MFSGRSVSGHFFQFLSENILILTSSEWWVNRTHESRLRVIFSQHFVPMIPLSSVNCRCEVICPPNYPLFGKLPFLLAGLQIFSLSLVFFILTMMCFNVTFCLFILCRYYCEGLWLSCSLKSSQPLSLWIGFLAHSVVSPSEIWLDVMRPLTLSSYDSSTLISSFSFFLKYILNNFLRSVL